MDKKIDIVWTHCYTATAAVLQRLTGNDEPLPVTSSLVYNIWLSVQHLQEKDAQE